MKEISEMASENMVLPADLAGKEIGEAAGDKRCEDCVYGEHELIGDVLHCVHWAAKYEVASNERTALDGRCGPDAKLFVPKEASHEAV